jgi:hypothetical protein
MWRPSFNLQHAPLVSSCRRDAEAARPRCVPRGGGLPVSFAVHRDDDASSFTACTGTTVRRQASPPVWTLEFGSL